jgi:molybdopterin converting factor small subunit
MRYPDVLDPTLIGSYSASAHAGGGYVWDAVLEYRVWCHPERGAPDVAEGSDYYYPFATYKDALDFSESNEGTEEPLALILQEEFIDEPEAGRYIHVKERRIAEWPVSFLTRPRRTPNTIPDFFAPNAPANRLDIIRGLAMLTGPTPEPPMTVTFWLPGPLRSMTGGRSHVDVETSGGTLQDALDALFAAHPSIRDRVLTERGEIREHVNVFVGKSEARQAGGLATPLADGMQISIIPAISGG